MRESSVSTMDRNLGFPETKYMGSKQRLLPLIREGIRKLKFQSVLDAFSGSGCVGYMLKRMGVQVYANDFMKFCFHVARATVENNSIRLDAGDVSRLISPNGGAESFIADTYSGLFFSKPDCVFLDHLRHNIEKLNHPLKRSLALAAASRACLKKRPRGIFTFTGNKGWDGRRDLRLTMREQFEQAVDAYNASIFSNGYRNRVFNVDVFDLSPDLADVVYLDPPYISRYSDSDYVRRYHFVEGFCTYWKGVEVLWSTKTRKLRSYETAFANKQGAVDAFRRLFEHFRKSAILLSYSSNGIPSRSEIVRLLREYKSKVTVMQMRHRYHHGNHAHKIGNNESDAVEYLFIAR